MLHRETSAYTTAYRRPAVYLYVTDFPIMSIWNIVCNTNTHHILHYCYDIVINNIYAQNSVSLKPICLDAAYGRPVCNLKLIFSYTYLQYYIFNADLVYPKSNTMIIITR